MLRLFKLFKPVKKTVKIATSMILAQLKTLWIKFENFEKLQNMNKNQELRGANCHNGLACNQTDAPWGGGGCVNIHI